MPEAPVRLQIKKNLQNQTAENRPPMSPSPETTANPSHHYCFLSSYGRTAGVDICVCALGAAAFARPLAEAMQRLKSWSANPKHETKPAKCQRGT